MFFFFFWFIRILWRDKSCCAFMTEVSSELMTCVLFCVSGVSLFSKHHDGSFWTSSDLSPSAITLSRVVLLMRSLGLKAGKIMCWVKLYWIQHTHFNRYYVIKIGVKTHALADQIFFKSKSDKKVICFIFWDVDIALDLIETAKMIQKRTSPQPCSPYPC